MWWKYATEVLSGDFEEQRRLMAEWDAQCDAALAETLSTVGAQIVADYCPDTTNGTRRDYWLATDVGLAILVIRRADGQTKAIADWTAWPDVRDPEIRTNVIVFAEGTHRTVRLTVQLPRIDLESGSNLNSLDEFAAAVLRFSGRR
jgi:hypothetical protein